MKIVFFTRHENLGASSRYRSIQFFDYLSSKGHQVKSHYFFTDDYLSSRYSGEKPYFKIFMRYISRLWAVMHIAWRADLVFIEKELFPFLPAFSEKFLFTRKAKKIYDYDDAIWHSYEQIRFDPLNIFKKKISRVVSKSDLTIAGSNYLADKLTEMGSKSVFKLPTVVPQSRYFGQGIKAKKTADIVWIGSMSTAKHLEIIFTVLERIYIERGSVSRLIGFPKSFFPSNLPPYIEIHDWSPKTEVELISSSRIGVMPLPDRDFERGKCGFKLIQYMGLGLPTVASPVGENKYIVKDGVSGFHATSCNEWFNKIKLILDNPDMATEMGLAGFDRFKLNYSTEIASKKLNEIFLNLSGTK